MTRLSIFKINLKNYIEMVDLQKDKIKFRVI